MATTENVQAATVSVEAVVRRTVEKVADEFSWKYPERVVEAMAARLNRLASYDKAVVNSLVANEEMLRRESSVEYFAQMYDRLRYEASESEAWKELFEPVWYQEEVGTKVSYRGYLFVAAHRFLRTQWSLPVQEAEEIAVDAASMSLINIRNRMDQCQGRESYWGWCTRIVQNAVRDQLRKGRPSESSLSEAAAESQVEKVVDRVAVLDEVARKRRLGKLSEDQVFLLHRFFWQDEPISAIAAALSKRAGRSITPELTSVWKSRALSTLAHNLREEGFSG